LINAHQWSSITRCYHQSCALVNFEVTPDNAVSCDMVFATATILALSNLASCRHFGVVFAGEFIST